MRNHTTDASEAPRPATMSDEDYVQAQESIVLLARLVQCIDLPGFLARISQAEAVGPILEPTLYRAAMDNLEAIKRLAEALLPFQRKAMALRDVDRREASE